MTIVAGIDPGSRGAFAFIDIAAMRVVSMIDMAPLAVGQKTKIQISPPILLAKLRELPFEVRHAFIEVSQAYPKQGVSSSHRFGRAYGIAETEVAAMGWPLTYVTAGQWKKAMQVSASKDDARARASQLLPLDTAYWTPQRGVMDKDQAGGYAEAALIGLYGARSLEPIVLTKLPKPRKPPRPARQADLFA